MAEKKELLPIRSIENKSIEELIRTQNYISPSVNIYDNEDEFVLVADMPGSAKDRVKVKVEDDSLIMFGQIDYDNDLKRDYLLLEREIGNYYRVFKISESVDREKIDAKFENGQLIVRLPKKEKVKPKVIDIS